MQEIRQNSLVEIAIGPFVSNSDGVTPVTDMTLTGADEKALIKHNGTTAVSINGNSFAAITSMDGYYNMFVTSAQLDTLGQLTIIVQDDNKCVPVWKDFMVVDSGYWARKYGTTYLATQAAVSSLDTRVSSLSTTVSSVQTQVGSLYTRVSSIFTRQGSMNWQLGTLPNSQTLNAHILTLPTSEELNSHILTLPTSEELNDHVATLATSEAMANIMDARLQNINLDHLMKTAVADSSDLTAEVVDYSVLALLMAAGGDTSLFVSSDDSLQRISEAAGGASQAQVQSACYSALDDINLNHLMKDAVANSSDLTSEITDYSALALIMAAGGDTSAFVSSDDSLQGISEGAAGGGASQAEVQSACFAVMDDINLDHLMKTAVADSSDLTAEITDYSALALIMAAGGDTSAFVSSDDSLQGISEGAAGGGASQAEVQSACFTAMNDHGVDTIDGDVSSVAAHVESIDAQLDTLPTSLTLEAQINTLPTSQTLNAHILTLPTSEELNDHVLTLPLSEHVADAKSVLDTLPTSGELNDYMVTLPLSTHVANIDGDLSSVAAQVNSIDNDLAAFPNSETLNAHILTLPTSEELNAHILTLPTSSVLDDHVATLPTSSTLDDSLPSGVKKGVRIQNFLFVMVDSADNITPQTGLTVTGQISKDGAAFTGLTNAPAEVGNGLYKVDVTSDELNVDMAALRFTATGATDVIRTIKTSS